MRIESERPPDRPAVHALLQRAFDSDPRVAGLVEDLRVDVAWRDGLAFVARHPADGVVGYLLLTAAELIEPGGATRALLQLSPLGVDPAYQGIGIGSALVRYGLSVTDARSEPAVVLEGNPVYYRRFGFVAAAPIGILRPYTSGPAWAFQVRTRPGAAAVTGQVRVAAPFDVLAGPDTAAAS